MAVDGEFSVNMPQVTSVIEQMRTANQKIQATTDELEAQAASNLQLWTGAARENYTVCKAAWDSAVHDMNTVLNSSSQRLQTINDNHAATENANHNLW